MNLDKEAAEAYRDAMLQFEKEMERTNEYSLNISGKTNVIIRLVSGMGVAIMLYIFYSGMLLGDDMKALSHSMVEMYQHFGDMSEDVQSMRQSVVKMGESMHGIPLIAEDMSTMQQNLNSMTGSVDNMDTQLTSMDQNVAEITTDMNVMTQEFGKMNHSVDYMRYNVQEMSRSIP